MTKQFIKHGSTMVKAKDSKTLITTLKSGLPITFANIDKGNFFKARQYQIKQLTKNSADNDLHSKWQFSTQLH
jgi:hypothetical protein